MMEFELLRSFVTVAECGGFRRAAERLNLTQSTVSQQIKRLELETKRPLFRRTTRAVALTDDGEMLLGDARRQPRRANPANHCAIAHDRQVEGGPVERDQLRGEIGDSVDECGDDLLLRAFPDIRGADGGWYYGGKTVTLENGDTCTILQIE
jgi:DNA-binding MarR family transcriptional regulator